MSTDARDTFVSGCFAGALFGFWLGGLIGIIVHGHTTHTLWDKDPEMCSPENICGECVSESDSQDTLESD